MAGPPLLEALAIDQKAPLCVQEEGISCLFKTCVIQCLTKEHQPKLTINRSNTLQMFKVVGVEPILTNYTVSPLPKLIKMTLKYVDDILH